MTDFVSKLGYQVHNGNYSEVTKLINELRVIDEQIQNGASQTTRRAIPSNDDAAKAISLVIGHIAKAIEEGLSERKADKDKEPKESREPKAAKKETRTKAKKG